MDRAEAVAAELQIVGHGACTSVAEVEGCFLVKWWARICIGDVHVRECEAVEDASSSIADLRCQVLIQNFNNRTKLTS